VPDDMDPVLEELPKWSLLAEVLKEIEEEMMRQESLGATRSTCGSLLSILFYKRDVDSMSVTQDRTLSLS